MPRNNLFRRWAAGQQRKRHRRIFEPPSVEHLYSMLECEWYWRPDYGMDRDMWYFLKICGPEMFAIRYGIH